MKIINFKAENIKRLVAVEITPQGHLNIVGGKNAAGKSSVLDAIEMALGGKKSACDVPVRKGQETGYVVVELDDITVKRIFGSNGTTHLSVTNKDNAAYPSPQAMLDKLVGSLSFDPLAFMRMAPKEKLVTLMQLLGLDFTEQDGKRAGLYDNRTTVGRDVKNLKGQLAGTTQHADAPAEEVSVGELVKKVEDGMEANSDNEKVRQEVQRMESQLADRQTELQQVTDNIQYLQQQQKDRLSDIEDRKDAISRGRQEVTKLKDVDLGPVHDAISGAEATNQKVRENQARANVAKRLKDVEGEYKKLSGKIDAIDGDKDKSLAGAKFPIESLAFSDSGVVYNDLPLDQASQAEQLRVSVAMGIAMNPELRVLLIRDGSLLDGESLELLRTLATDSDIQVWLERVGEGKECQVVISDGMVKGAKSTGKDSKDDAGNAE